MAFAPLLAIGAFACELETEDCVEIGKWELSLGVGAGIRTNPLEATPDIPLFLIPEVNYNGERFFIQNLDFGFILWESETQQLNLLATPSYDQVYFHRWSPSNFFIDSNGFATTGKGSTDDEDLPVIDTGGDKELIAPGFKDVQTRQLRNRRMAGLGGIEYSVTTTLVDLQLQYVTDFTGVHDGDEVRVALAKYWSTGRHQISASVGAIWQSSEVINYYYGVTGPEADLRGTYSTDAVLTPVARVEWNYQMTERWDLRFLANYRQLPDEISASPLINDNKVITVFIGGVYHF
ncbi:MipA/OmpV family protein [Cellvibrio fibrivorans]|uniref:Outer membrane protein n=1 Tax=Cellvibrio fibrivorans TaxID=126350 RepID=A0ABU1UUK4_9GAMM|nr:MipA/OmpV family protein [Cellvibrio fibrivorans]MDR7088875.1 outer membrane protein [Cellvibrio fibrivorans]